MRKAWIYRLTLFFCMAGLTGILRMAAAAGENAVNPIQGRVWELEQLASSREQFPLVPRGYKPVTLTCTANPALDGTGKWSLSYNTATYGAVRDVIFQLSMKDYSTDYTTVYHIEKNGAQASFTSCKIVSGGSYRLTVFARMGSMSGYYYDSYDFTIQDDANHTSLTEKVSQVVRSCRANTPWQTALNLHDWLVKHVYYDLNYQYYGADMILRGYGVCDGYSKAYYMLCREAGITVSRVIGDAGGSHAWNAVRLDGQWYYVDPTWDDPAGDSVAESGQERYQYFCVNEKILSLDHTNDKTVFSGSCTSLEANYYIHTDEWKEWGGDYYYIARVCHVIPFISQIQDSFDRGDFSCTLSQDVIWYPGVYGDRSRWRKIIVAYGLERTSFMLSNGGAIRVSVSAGTDDWPVTVRLSGWDLQETGTLKIPAGTTMIEAGAFEKSPATTVRLSSSCRRIESRAFANSALRTVYIPASSLSYIAGDAFFGCARIIFVTDNEAVISYAAQHGYIVVAPSSY